MSALALTNSACTELLLGDTPFVHESSAGGGGAGGEAGSSGGGGSTVSTTAPLMCDNGTTACGDSCVDLDSDAANCGACGRSCLGSTCQSGLCAPETVATGIDDPRGIAVDGAFVYWTTGSGLVQRASKEGGALLPDLATGQDAPGAIALDEQDVYWINEATGRVMRIDKEGSKSKLLLTSPGLLGLAIDSQGLYLSRKLKKGTIQRVGKDGAGSFTIAEGQPAPSFIALIGDQVMWTGQSEADDDGDADGKPDGAEGRTGGYVHCAPTNGGTQVVLASGEGQIVGLVSAEGTAVWADVQNRRLRAQSMDAPKPSTLVDNQDVRGLVAYGDEVYWTTAGGSVKRVSVNGGSPQVLAIEMEGVGAAAVDESYVYFTKKGSPGAILRVAR
ncbi:MAG: hypothetical protein U0441_11740 [Polyangiaceae bacterium]